MSNKQQNLLPSSDSVIFCIDTHLEWHSSNQHQHQHHPGKTNHSLAVIKKDICVTPGLTQVVTGGHTPFPKLKSHHSLPFRLPPCASNDDSGGDNGGKGVKEEEGDYYQENDMIDSSSDPSSPCLYRLSEIPRAAAIRARTPTSAGMADVVIGRGSSAATVNATHESTDIEMTTTPPTKMSSMISQKQEQHLLLRRFLFPDFGIRWDELEVAQDYLQEHLKDIAKDNLEGQCTKGHSCKEESRSKLKQFIWSSDGGVGGG